MRDWIDLCEGMVLNELYGLKNHAALGRFKATFNNGDIFSRHNRLEDFVKTLDEQGFRPLGSGLYGIVFTHPSLDYVVKVFGEDTNYTDFVRMCMQDVGNPHLPKFRGKVIRIDDKFSLVRMEKLFLPDELDMSIMTIIGKYCRALNLGEDAIGLMNRLHSGRRDVDPVWDKIEANPGIFDTIDEIVARFGSEVLDLHPQNMMMRGQTIVITDPVMTIPDDL